MIRLALQPAQEHIRPQRDILVASLPSLPRPGGDAGQAGAVVLRQREGLSALPEFGGGGAVYHEPGSTAKRAPSASDAAS